MLPIILITSLHILILVYIYFLNVLYLYLFNILALGVISAVFSTSFVGGCNIITGSYFTQILLSGKIHG